MKTTLAITFEFDCPEDQLQELIGNLNGIVEDAIADGRITGEAEATLLGYRVEAARPAEPARQVRCQFWRQLVPAGTAHLHGGDWVGDECCWDERLRSSE